MNLFQSHPDTLREHISALPGTLNKIDKYYPITKVSCKNSKEEAPVMHCNEEQQPSKAVQKQSCLRERQLSNTRVGNANPSRPGLSYNHYLNCLIEPTSIQLLMQ